MRVDSASLRRYGLTDAEIEAVWDFENGPFSEAEKAAMRLAGVLSNAEPDGRVDERLMAQLQAHFTDGQIMELAMVCAVITGMAKMIFAFDLAAKDAVCPLPMERPIGS